MITVVASHGYAESTDTEMYLPPSVIEAPLHYTLGVVNPRRVAGISHLSWRGTQPAATGEWLKYIQCPTRYHDPVGLVATP